MPAGRPTVMTEETRAAICDLIAEGHTIREIAGMDGMPAASTIYLAAANDEAFSEQYVKAREAQLARWEDELLEIADDGTNDWTTRQNADGSEVEVINTDVIARSRLRVDTRKWIMSKRLPKRYGDRVSAELTGKDGESLKPEPVTAEDFAKAFLSLVNRS